MKLFTSLFDKSIIDKRKINSSSAIGRSKSFSGDPVSEEIPASNSGPYEKLLFIKDRISNVNFLIDTGAEICVLPPKIVQNFRYNPTQPKARLIAANHSEIASFGELTFSIDLGLGRLFQWPFLIAEVSTPIIGNDFLSKHNIWICPKRKLIYDPDTKVHSKCCSRTDVESSNATLQPINQPQNDTVEVIKQPDAYQAGSVPPKSVAQYQPQIPLSPTDPSLMMTPQKQAGIQTNDYFLKFAQDFLPTSHWNEYSTFPANQQYTSYGPWWAGTIITAAPDEKHQKDKRPTMRSSQTLNEIHHIYHLFKL